MKEVAPGIYQLQQPLANYVTSFTNVYVLRVDKSFLMIDTGWDTEAASQAMKSQLGEIGLEMSGIRELVVTHCHTDHYSMAARLKRQFNVKLYAHAKEIELIKTRLTKGVNFTRETEQLLFENGVPATELAAKPPPLPEVGLTMPDVTLQGGETIRFGSFSLKVLWTPGHSPGHVCLYEPEQRLLFSGDLILPTIATNIGLHLQYRSNSLGDYLESLDKIKMLDVKMVLPAHEHAFGNMRQRIQELVRHHERKSRLVMEILADGKPMTAYQVSITLSSRNGGGAGWDSLPPWDKRFAVMETLARLQFLRFNGKADMAITGGITHYRASQGESYKAKAV